MTRRVVLLAAAAVLGLGLLATTMLSRGHASSLGVASQPMAAQRTCTLTAYPKESVVEDDTYVMQSSAGSKHGGERSVLVNGPTTQIRRALIHFDLTKCAPALTSATHVVSARLRLYVASASSSATYGASRVTATWSEAEATWTSQPAVATPATAVNTIGASDANTYREWTVTPDVQLFLQGTANNGWMLALSDETASASASFWSREQNTPQTAPQLVVAYT